jgi:hypothetical protein
MLAIHKVYLCIDDCSINLKYEESTVYTLSLSADVHLERQIKSLFFDYSVWESC